MEDIDEALIWRMRALTVAKRLRAQDPAITTHELAVEISRQVAGAPRNLDTTQQRLLVWERTGAIPSWENPAQRGSVAA